MADCLLAANHGSKCSLTRAVDDRIVRCGIISSCQSASTSEIVKALLATSLFHVRSAMASTGLYLSPTYDLLAHSQTVETNAKAAAAGCSLMLLRTRPVG